MTEKERHRIMLDHDLVEAAKRLGYSLSDAVEKGLRLLISAHGGHSQPTNGQSMQNREKLAELKNELKKSKETIEYLVKKDRMLTETVEKIPVVFDELKKIRAETDKQKQSQDLRFGSAVNHLREKIKDADSRLKVVEGKLDNALYQINRTPSAEIDSAIQPLYNRIKISEGRLKALESKLRNTKDRTDKCDMSLATGNKLPQHFF